MRLSSTLLFSLLTLASLGQTSINGNLVAYVDSVVDHMPGEHQENFVLPTPSEKSIYYRAVRHLCLMNATAAIASADSLGYRVRIFNDTTSAYGVFYLLEESPPAQRHWGMVAIRPSACMLLLLQAPHPGHDFNTGQQAAYNFVHLPALAFMMSTAHRCNSDSLSACDGTTSVCTGSPSPFARSDNAHNEVSAFQAATEAIIQNTVVQLTLQLHGFTKLSTDPYVIMSNGTKQPDLSGNVEAFRDALLAQDSALTFEIGHLNPSWDRLLGTVNVQGRFINNSPDPCDQNPVAPSGMFIHMEQEKSRLRQDVAGWEKVRLAIETFMPCLPWSVDDPVIPAPELFPNPSTGAVTVRQTGCWKLEVLNSMGGVVLETDFCNEINLNPTLPAGLYLVVLKNNGQRSLPTRLLIY